MLLIAALYDFYSQQNTQLHQPAYYHERFTAHHWSLMKATGESRPPGVPGVGCQAASIVPRGA